MSGKKLDDLTAEERERAEAETEHIKRVRDRLFRRAEQEE